MLFFMRFFAFSLFWFLCSCSKNYLYVQQEVYNEESLASTMVKTPDPRRDTPFYGQKILIGWDFPLSQFRKDLSLKLTVRFWNNEEKTFEEKISKQRHYTSFFFSNNEKDREKKILTYKVDVFTKEGTIIQTWEHQFWTRLMELDKS